MTDVNTNLDDWKKLFIEKKAVISVVGLGYTGLPLAKDYCDKGFKVIGFDTDEIRIKKINESASPVSAVSEKSIKRITEGGYLKPILVKDVLSNSKNINVQDSFITLKKKDILVHENDSSLLNEINVFFICVPTPFVNHQSLEPDLSYIVSAVSFIGVVISEMEDIGSFPPVIILESTTYPGTTRDVASNILIKRFGLNHGKDFLIGYSPERVDPGDGKKEFLHKHLSSIISQKGDMILKIKELTDMSQPGLMRRVFCGMSDISTDFIRVALEQIYEDMLFKNSDILKPQEFLREIQSGSKDGVGGIPSAVWRKLPVGFTGVYNPNEESNNSDNEDYETLLCSDIVQALNSLILRDEFHCPEWKDILEREELIKREPILSRMGDLEESHERVYFNKTLFKLAFPKFIKISYSTRLHQVRRLEIAESAKLTENIIRNVQINLANQLAWLYRKFDIDVWETLEAVKTKGFGLDSCFPGAGVGGHCIPIDPGYFLSYCSEMNDYSLPKGIGSLIQCAFDFSEKHINLWSDLVIEKILEKSNKNHITGELNQPNVLFLGVTYKEDIEDCRMSPVINYITNFVDNGIGVSCFDYNLESKLFQIKVSHNSLENLINMKMPLLNRVGNSEFSFGVENLYFNNKLKGKKFNDLVLPKLTGFSAVGILVNHRGFGESKMYENLLKEEEVLIFDFCDGLRKFLQKKENGDLEYYRSLLTLFEKKNDADEIILMGCSKLTLENWIKDKLRQTE
ncbi:MAG: hypothetical protein HN757_14475 [Calditrichaeota bacterium]|jgi:UDP-N-acetyl-D-mannosaminuronate dehydrogenase|nr:hypothetical protein [Calditrichota bacterium]